MKYKTEFFIFLTVFIVYSFFTFLKIFHHLPVESLAADQYFQIANNLATHSFFSLDGVTPTALRTPGYPFFLAGAFKLVHSWWGVLIIQNLLPGLSAVLLYLISRYWLSQRWAIIVSFIWALEPYAIEISSEFMTETLYVAILLITILVFLKYQYENKTGKYSFILIQAVLASLLIYIRPISIFLPVIFILIMNHALIKKNIHNISRISILKEITVKTLLYFSLILLLLSPWLVRNHSIFNSWLLSSDNMACLHLLPLVFEANQKGLGMNVIGREPSEFLHSGDINNVQQTKNQAIKGFRAIFSKPLSFTKFYLKNTFISTLSSSWWGSLRNLFKGSSGQVNYSKEVAQTILHHDIQQMLTWSGKNILAAIIMIAGIIFWITTFIFFFIGSYMALKHSDDKLRTSLFLLLGIVAYILIIGNVAVGDTIRYRFAVSPIIIMLAVYGLYYLKEMKRIKFN